MTAAAGGGVEAAQLLAQLALCDNEAAYAKQQQSSACCYDAQLLPSADLAGMAALIAAGRARSIVVMAGAGISVSAGIPDFRTPGTGLYSRLARYNLPWPEAVFDLRFFRHNPAPFYHLAKELFPGRHCPTATHFFLRLLHEKGLLRCVFTQNVDGLEQLAGVPHGKVVAAHGSFDDAHCINCGSVASMYAVQQAAHDGDVATCSGCGGYVKPGIVFFGEALPARFHARRLSELGAADLLLVLGTSLSVQPFASMIDAVPADTPRALINMERVGERKQQAQQAQGQRATKPLRDRRRGSDSSSDSSSSGGSDESVDRQSVTGCDSDAGSRLTSSSSFVDSTAAGGDDVAAGRGSAAAAPAAPVPAAGGFDFSDARRRDALHLGACDDAVTELAGILGWEKELRQLVEQGRRAFEAAAAEWDE